MNDNSKKITNTNAYFPRTILLKCDTVESYKESNPVLNDRELVCVKMEDGTIKYKLGDGITPFIDLPYTNCRLLNILKFI